MTTGQDTVPKDKHKRRLNVDLRKSLFILPNLFTLSSVLCGFAAILLCIDAPTDKDFHRAAMLVVFAMFFDALDGRVARLTHTQSAIGVQLDSLADVISFGVVPSILVYRWSLEQLNVTGWFFQGLNVVGLLVGFVYIACGAIRLARFNVLAVEDSGAPKVPGKYILGLPVPAAAGVLISLVLVDTITERTIPGGPAIIAAVMLALSFFMVSTFRFRSFKDLQLNTRTLLFTSIVLGSAVVLAVLYHASVALVWLLGNYVIMAIVESAFGWFSGRRKLKQANTETTHSQEQA